jgi:hypothetical protein
VTLPLRWWSRASGGASGRGGHATPNQPFGAPSIEAKLAENGIGFVDTARVGSVVQHRQRLSGAGTTFELFPVEKFGHVPPSPK